LEKLNHHDRRVRRTQKLFREAFLKLIAEKDYNQITVTEIIEEADYNRATFYRHYYDKEDFVNELIDNQTDLFIEAFMRPYRYESVIDLDNLQMKHIVIFDHILEHREFYSLWNRLRTIPFFAEKYMTMIRVIFQEKLVVTRSLNKGIDKELYMQFYGYGLVGVIYNWIISGFEKSSNHMAEQLMLVLKIKPGKSMLYPGVE